MRAVFLDRDGVINKDVGYPHRREDLVLLPRSIAALVALSEQLPVAQWKLIIVTNQSVLARGMCTQDEFEAFMALFFETLGRESSGRIRIDDFLYCPHHPTHGVGALRVDCDRRKPKPGLLLEAARRYDLDLSGSYMIGDMGSDILAGQAAGCHSILVQTGRLAGEVDAGITPDETYPDLFAAAASIIQREGIAA